MVEFVADGVVDDGLREEEEGRCVGMVSPAREPCSRSSAKMRCLLAGRVSGLVLYLREGEGVERRERGKDVLPRQPAPKLERLLADTPPSRQISELAHVRRVVREGE